VRPINGQTGGLIVDNHHAGHKRHATSRWAAGLETGDGVDVIGIEEQDEQVAEKGGRTHCG